MHQLGLQVFYGVRRRRYQNNVRDDNDWRQASTPSRVLSRRHVHRGGARDLANGKTEALPDYPIHQEQDNFRILPRGGCRHTCWYEYHPIRNCDTAFRKAGISDENCKLTQGIDYYRQSLPFPRVQGNGRVRTYSPTAQGYQISPQTRLVRYSKESLNQGTIEYFGDIEVINRRAIGQGRRKSNRLFHQKLILKAQNQIREGFENETVLGTS